MTWHALTLPEVVMIFVIMLELVVIMGAIGVLIVTRQRSMVRDKRYGLAKDHLSELVEQLGVVETGEVQQRALAIINRLDRDNGRRLLVEIGEFLSLDHIGPLASVFRLAGYPQEALNDANKRPWERLRAIREARALGDPANLLPLLLKDEQPDVKLGAFEAACALSRADEAFEALLDIATYGRLAKMRAVDALAATEPLPLSQLRELCRHDVASLRLIAVGALGRAGRSDALDEIVSAATDTDVEVRIESLRAMKELSDIRALPASVACLSDEFWEVRSVACGVVAHLGGDGAAVHLAPLVDDYAEWVRHNAALALRRCGPAGVAALREAAANGSESAGSALAEHRIQTEGA